jgi:hypothetical protein
VLSFCHELNDLAAAHELSNLYAASFGDEPQNPVPSLMMGCGALQRARVVIGGDTKPSAGINLKVYKVVWLL